MRSTGQNAVPYPVQRELKKLGEDIRKARIRRKLTMKELSERAFISENTLASVQKGKESVGHGHLCPRACSAMNYRAYRHAGGFFR